MCLAEGTSFCKVRFVSPYELLHIGPLPSLKAVQSQCTIHNALPSIGTVLHVRAGTLLMLLLVCGMGRHVPIKEAIDITVPWRSILIHSLIDPFNK